MCVFINLHRKPLDKSPYSYMYDQGFFSDGTVRNGVPVPFLQPERAFRQHFQTLTEMCAKITKVKTKFKSE